MSLAALTYSAMCEQEGTIQLFAAARKVQNVHFAAANSSFIFIYSYSYNLQQYNQIKSNKMIKTIQLRGNQAIKWHLWQPIYIIQQN